MGDRYKVTFTAEELKKFSAMNSFGVPIQKMKPYLALDMGARNKTENALGIPCDSTDNQLADWLFYARDIKGKELKIAVKGDKDTPYPMVKKVITTLQDKNENKFNLITGLEANPMDDKKKK
jgi:biopolymer transport protein ExbD